MSKAPSFLPDPIDFRVHNFEEWRIVWIEGINRYICFLEPAFYVFECLAKGELQETIASACSHRYNLPADHSNRFTKEVMELLERVYRETQDGLEPEQKISGGPAEPPVYRIRNYRIWSKDFRMAFGDLYLEELFHPFLSPYTLDAGIEDTPFFCELFFQEEFAVLRINRKETLIFPKDEPERYQGAFSLQLINYLYDRKTNDWMGVLHASAVSDGHTALLFTGDSGSGKSTIATFLMKAGFRVLSDDFVPIAMTSPEICSFPAAISVKSSAFPLIKKVFPEIGSYLQKETPEDELDEWFIPQTAEISTEMRVPARAIIFVRYDPEVAFSLKRESNLTLMNALIHQLWIANNPDAASRFMAWYFNLPVFTLLYSDDKQAVEALIRLFRNE